MGNSQSNFRSRVSQNTPPKHLRPLTPKKQEKYKKTDSWNLENSHTQDSKKTRTQYPQKKRVPILIPDYFEHKKNESFDDSGPCGAFRWLKGRRFFNNDSSCLLPNDQIEMDRARVQAFLLRWVFGGTVSPLPLENGITVLNIGHGSGMWQPGHHMIDLALDYRESLFVTIEICDLLPDDFEEEEEKINKDIVEISSNQFTPIHPSLPIKLQTTTKPHNESANSFSSSNTNSIFVQETDGDIKDYMEKPVKRHLLKNLDFYRMNVMKECLPFEDNQFDFVKQRLATAAFTLDNWKHVLAEMLRVTKPGGWIGLLEIDLSTVNLGSHGTQFEEQMAEAARSIGIEPRMAIYLTEILKALGLEEIKKQSVSIPLGEWGLNLGTLWKNNLESFAESLEPLISKLMKLSKEEYKEKWRIYFEEALHTKPFSNAYIVLGRKPLGNDSTIDWSLCPVFGQK